ncbi:adenosine receptor A1-like [Misgurnus anguillicaudatus]|uniref:adenosine receptor A1-like n=1 Tax=Misgurnus anguillicaudatus TaxID=75329 RepID=UPI003CCFB7A8
MSNSELVIYTVSEVFIALLCCLGNLLVIWAVWSSRVLRKTTFCFVVSLAVADFLVGAVVVPLAVLIDGRVQTRFYTCLFISCVVIVLTQASVHSLLAIAVDRFLRVHNPLRYRGAIKKQNLWAAVTICWVSASFLGFVPLFGWHNEDPTTNGTSTFTCQFLAVIPMSYLVNFFFFICIVPPTLIMFALYLYIFCTISKQLRKGIGQAAESRSFLQKERRLASSLALVLALFAICWFPIHIMNSLSYFYPSLNMPSLVVHIGILLSHGNSAVNPIVYAFKVPKIKTAYKNILMKLTSWKQNTDQNSQNLDKTVSSSNTNIRYKVKNAQTPEVVLTISQDL